MTDATQQSLDAVQQSQEMLHRAFDASMGQMMPAPLGSFNLNPFIDAYFDAAEQMLKMQRQFFKSLVSGITTARD